jgi:UDP-N-acetylglucosamine--N-acetylmuramyl-(pentapeptide) pyrophosphoryl-undecaprenol N-acetylglucosamine transferase
VTAQTWAIIAGGGTAGHVVPGLAIADALVDAGHPSSSILYVGSERGIEKTMVPAAGYECVLLPGRGIQRRLTFANVASVWGLVRAVVTAFTLVRRRRPAVVVALGGYASVPAALAAVLLRVPVVVAEQNAVPGAANRLVGRFAAACAVSFPDTALPRRTWTGNPVRGAVRTVDRRDAEARDAARRAMGLEGTDASRVLVVAFGGSLGARRVNEAVIGWCRGWADRGDVAVRHVIGERDWDREAASRAALDDDLHRRRAAGEPALAYTAVRYEHDMASVYRAADIALCRAGASTVAELAVVGLPAVLVPLPGAPGDHQTANARALERAGAAIVVPDGALDPDRVAAELAPIVADPDRRDAMARSARSVARPEAASAVAEVVEAHARRQR